MRLRVPAASAGTGIGVREAAKKYTIPWQSIQNWTKSGEVQVLQRPAQKGDQLVLSELSLQDRIKRYTPHKDSRSRRIRTRSPNPAPPPTSQPRPSDSPAPAPAPLGGNGRGGIRTRSASAHFAVRSFHLDLDTRPLVAEYFERCAAAQVKAITIEGYHWALDPFVAAFPVLPDDDQVVTKHVQALGGTPNTQRTRMKDIRTFYRWVARAKRVPVPQLSFLDLAKHTGRPRAYSQDEIHACLHAAQDPTERAIVIMLAQTAARRGGVCSLRAEAMQDHTALVKEKMGDRILYFPDEAWNAVRFAMGGKGYLTFHHAPLDPKALEKRMRVLLKRAGVYRLGSGEHAFRHAFQGEFIANGGKEIDAKVLMGHAPSNMTQHYYHLVNRDALEAVRKYAPTRFLQCALDCKFRTEVPV